MNVAATTFVVSTFFSFPWQETQDEADEEKQKQEKEKENDTEDAFHPEDPVQEVETKASEESAKGGDAVKVQAVKFKGLKSTSTSSREVHRTLTERGGRPRR